LFFLIKADADLFALGKALGNQPGKGRVSKISSQTGEDLQAFHKMQ